MNDHNLSPLSQLGFVELPQRTLIEMRGEDRATLLHNLCTAEIKSMNPGQGTEAFITNVKGKVLGHVFALVGDDAILLDTVGGQAAALVPQLDRYVIREDVQLLDRSDEFAHLLLTGPECELVVGQLGAPDGSLPADEALQHVGLTGVPDSSAMRSPMIEAGNFLIRVPVGQKPQIVSRLTESGAQRCDVASFEALRIEACFPYYGQDIHESNLPQEVGRDQEAISFTKGCYLGQETVARLDAMGHVNWKLASLAAESAEPLTSGVSLKSADEEVVAKLGSVAAVGQGQVSLAYVKSSSAEAGKTLETSHGAVRVVKVAGAT